jgi:hypothetical protein
MALTVSGQREYGLTWDINPPLKGKNLANDPFTVEGLNDPATLTLAPRGTRSTERGTEAWCLDWASPSNSAGHRIGCRSAR